MGDWSKQIQEMGQKRMKILLPIIDVSLID